MTISESVKSIGSYAFSRCIGLTSITIPNNVTNIGNSAFFECNGLTSVTIPDSITTIENNTFNSCSSLTSVTIPESVTVIEDYAFIYCGLMNVTIPDGVTSIGDYAFSSCSVSMNVTIPDSVTSIGNNAFNVRDNVILIVGKDSYAEQYAKDNKILYQYVEIRNTDNTTEEIKQPVPEQPLPKPPSTTEEKVVVGNVTMVPVETKTDEKPVIDDKVKNKNGSKTIKKGSVLTGKTGIYKVTNVNKKTVMYMKPKNKKASSIKVPEEIKIKKKKYKVTSVSANAFKNNKKIKTVTIGQNVKVIGKNAFRGCKNLKKVTIGKNVTTIESYAFYGCKKLNSIEIHSGKLKKVGKAAFKKIAKHPTARVPDGKIQSYKKLFEGKM